MAAPTLDGHATGSNSLATTVAATLTTTLTNDIICALVHVELSASGPGAMWVTGVSGGGLTWNKRRGMSNVSANSTLELWWAVAASALSSSTITATFNQSCDDSTILVFGVNGCNTAQPWDNNLTLPAMHQFNTTVAPSFTGISTTQASNFLIFGVGTTDNWLTIGTIPTGFTQIGFVLNNADTNASSVGAAFKSVTAAQTNQTFTWGSTIPGAQFQGGIALFDSLTSTSGALTTVPQIEFVCGTESTVTSDATAYVASPSASDLLVLISYCEVASGTAPTISSIVGGTGLTWVQRGRSHGSTFGSMEVWYAQTSGTLAITTLTVNYSASFDNTAVICFAVNGSATWDANAGLPVKVSNSGNANPWTPSGTISTTSAADLLFAAPGVRAAATNTTGPTGWQWVTNENNNTGGTKDAFLALAYKIVSAAQSSATVAWGSSLTEASGGEYVIDALTTLVVVTASITGVAGTGAVGNFVPNVQPSITGVAGTGVIGYPAPLLRKQVAVGGFPFTAFLAEAATNQTALTGQAWVVEYVPTAPAGNVPISGVAGTGAVGNVAIEIDASITGVAGTGAVGAVTVQTGTIASITGVSGTGQAGTVIAQVQPSATGVAGTGQAGTVTTQMQTSIIGVAGSGQAGTVTTQTGTAASITGVAGSGQVGNIATEIDVSIAGVSSTGVAGTVTASSGQNALVPIAGVSGTGAVGIITTSGSSIPVVAPVGGPGDDDDADERRRKWLEFQARKRALAKQQVAPPRSRKAVAAAATPVVPADAAHSPLAPRFAEEAATSLLEANLRAQREQLAGLVEKEMAAAVAKAERDLDDEEAMALLIGW